MFFITQIAIFIWRSFYFDNFFFVNPLTKSLRQCNVHKLLEYMPNDLTFTSQGCVLIGLRRDGVERALPTSLSPFRGGYHGHHSHALHRKLLPFLLQVITGHPIPTLRIGPANISLA